MYIMILIMVSCTSFLKQLRYKGKEQEFTIDWEINPYEHSDESNFVEVVFKDILDNGLYSEDGFCKFDAIADEDYILDIKKAWEVHNEQIYKNRQSALPEILEGMIRLLYLSKKQSEDESEDNNTKYFQDVVSHIYDFLNSDSFDRQVLYEKSLKLFEKAVIWNNFDLALEILKNNELQVDLINYSDIFLMDSNSERITKSFKFLITKDFVPEEELPEILTMITELRDADASLEIFETIFKKSGDFFIKLLSNNHILSIDDLEYDLVMVNKIYLRYYEENKFSGDDLLRIVSESKLIMHTSKSPLLGYIIKKIYSKFKEKENGKEREFLVIILDLEDLVRIAYISLDLELFIEILEVLYESKGEEEFLDKINYIDEEGKSTIFIGSEEEEKDRDKRITTILFGLSNHFSDKNREDINRVLQENRNHLSSFEFEGAQYWEYNKIVDYSQVEERWTKLVKASSEGDIEEVEKVLEELKNEEVSVNAKLKNGDIPLIFAAISGNEDLVKLLLSKGAYVNIRDNYGRTALSRVIKDENENYEEVAKLLISEGADINTKILMLVISKKNINLLRLILEKGIDINTRDDQGDTLLMNAVKEGNKEITKLLISEGADVKAKTENGFTALIYASLHGNLEMIDILVDKSNIDETNSSGKSALMIASENGYKDLVELFLSKGSDLDKKDEDSFTAQQLAYKNRHKEIVEILKVAKSKKDEKSIKTRIKIEKVIKKDVPEIRYSVKGENDRTVLYDRNKERIEINEKSLPKSIRNLLFSGNKVTLEDLVKKSASMNLLDILEKRLSFRLSNQILGAMYEEYGEKLTETFIRNNVSMLQFITLLTIISDGDRDRLIELVSKAEKKIEDIKGKDQKDLLFYRHQEVLERAIPEGYVEVIEILLNFRPNSRFRISDKERSNLILLIKSDRDNESKTLILQELLKIEDIMVAYEFINRTDKEGKSALEHAILKQDCEIVKILMREAKNLDISLESSDGYTPLLLTLKLASEADSLVDSERYLQIARVLVTSPLSIANIFNSSLDGMNALDLAKKIDEKVFNALKSMLKKQMSGNLK